MSFERPFEALLKPHTSYEFRAQGSSNLCPVWFCNSTKGILIRQYIVNVWFYIQLFIFLWCICQQIGCKDELMQINHFDSHAYLDKKAHWLSEKYGYILNALDRENTINHNWGFCWYAVSFGPSDVVIPAFQF